MERKDVLIKSNHEPEDRTIRTGIGHVGRQTAVYV